jgi:hypothetical protein
MAFSYDQLVEVLGPPDLDESAKIDLKGARGSLTRRPPIIVPHSRLGWRCGCRAEMAFGGSYALRQCISHARRG